MGHQRRRRVLLRRDLMVSLVSCVRAWVRGCVGAWVRGCVRGCVGADGRGCGWSPTACVRLCHLATRHPYPSIPPPQPRPPSVSSKLEWVWGCDCSGCDCPDDAPESTVAPYAAPSVAPSITPSVLPSPAPSEPEVPPRSDRQPGSSVAPTYRAPYQSARKRCQPRTWSLFHAQRALEATRLTYHPPFPPNKLTSCSSDCYGMSCDEWVTRDDDAYYYGATSW